MSLLKQFLRIMVSMLAPSVLLWHIIPSLIPAGIHKLRLLSDGPWTGLGERGRTHVDNVKGLQSQLRVNPSIRLGGTHIHEIDESVSHADVSAVVVSRCSRMASNSLTCSHWQSQSSST